MKHYAFKQYNATETLVMNDGLALEHIHEQTEELCKLAIEQHALALQYVNEQTEALCKLAVSNRGDALQYVNEQTTELCKLAITRYGYNLRFVREQTIELIEIALLSNVSLCDLINAITLNTVEAQQLKAKLITRNNAEIEIERLEKAAWMTKYSKA